MDYIYEKLPVKTIKDHLPQVTALRVALFVYAGITLIGLYQTHRHTEIIKDLTDPHFMIMLILMILFIIFFNKYGGKKSKEATKHALAAWIIAYLGHIDLTFAAFAYIWILYYYGAGD